MRRILIGLNLFGAFFIILELFLKQQGKSICQTEGCQLAMGLARNENFILIIGTTIFLVLSLLFFLSKKRNLFPIIDVILIGVLSVEGYLIGIQFFFLSHLCSFCLIVGILFLIITLIYLFTYHRLTALAGIVSFIMVIFATYLILPMTGTLEEMAKICYIKGNPKDKWYLFVKENCPHCKKLLNYFLNYYKGDLKLYVCEAERCSLLLKKLGIKEVPVLLIEEKGKKEIFVGEQCILQGIEKKQLFPELFFYQPQGTCGLNTCQ